MQTYLKYLIISVNACLSASKKKRNLIIQVNAMQIKQTQGGLEVNSHVNLVTRQRLISFHDTEKP